MVSLVTALLPHHPSPTAGRTSQLMQKQKDRALLLRIHVLDVLESKYWVTLSLVGLSDFCILRDKFSLVLVIDHTAINSIIAKPFKCVGSNPLFAKDWNVNVV